MGVISVEEYTATLKGKDGISVAQPETQRKATNAINDFKAYLSKRGKTIPDELDIEAYRIESKSSKTNTDFKIKHIRGYYALNDERSKQKPMTEGNVKEPETQNTGVDDGASTERTAVNEPASLPKQGRKRSKNGEKRVPVSVYLEPETYNIMNTLAGLMNRSIGDIAASTLSEFAKKNASKIEAKAAEVKEALEAVKKAMEDFTLEC